MIGLPKQNITKENKMRKIIFIMMIAGIAFLASACSDAEIASLNVSRAADQFEVYRRVVFYNGITDTYILMVEGYCSIEVETNGMLAVMVKVGKGEYIKHYLGLSDNVTYFAEQLVGLKVSDTRYRVIFKPSIIVPNIDVE
jgi:hypothetical protein